MPVRGAAIGAAQQREPLGEPPADLLDGHGADAGCRELDGQRQPVEMATQFRDRVPRQIRVGPNGPGTGLEQGDRRSGDTGIQNGQQIDLFGGQQQR